MRYGWLPKTRSVSLSNDKETPVEHHFHAGEQASIRLARVLVELEIADPAEWRRVRCDPRDYVQVTLNRWIDLHGGKAIRRRFNLGLTLSESLNPYAEPAEDDPDGRQLYMVLQPDSAAYVVAGPTLEVLEREHPRLPVTFYRLFTRALNKWVRAWDYLGAEERVERLREWMEEEEEQYEWADVAAATPACMKRKALSAQTLRRMSTQVEGEQAKALLDALLQLGEVSGKAKRPELAEDIGEQFMDNNPPLPGVLIVFAEHDPVEHHFDDESQNMLEFGPEPNLIVPLNAFEPQTVRQAFDILAVVCDTLAAATHLIDLMPGNEKGINPG